MKAGWSTAMGVMRKLNSTLKVWSGSRRVRADRVGALQGEWGEGGGGCEGVWEVVSTWKTEGKV